MMIRILKRRFVVGILAMVIAGAFMAPAIAAQEEKINLRVGVIPLVEHLPLVVAQKDAMSQNVDFSIDAYSSWTALEAAFRTGAIDMAAITLPKALLMSYEGIQLKIVCVINRNGIAVVMNSDEAGKLKGKITGGSGNDTMDLIIFNRLLKDKKLKLGYDVRSLLIPFSKAISLIKEDRIYGFCLPEPYGAEAEKAKVAKKIIYSKDLYPNHPGSVLIVNPAIIKKYPEAVKGYVKSLMKASVFIEKDKSDSKGKQSAMSQVGIFKIDPELIVQSLTAPKDRILFTNQTPAVNEIEDIMKNLMSLGVLGGGVNLKDVVDTSYTN